MLEQLKEYIKKRFADEFAAQGHHLTGAAEESVSFNEAINDNRRSLEVLANYYVVYVDKGVKPSEIKSPYAPARIDGLTRYWKMRRGLNDKDAKRAAYATATKHAQEGMPTRNSERYSSTGKRTGFTLAMTGSKDIDKMGELIREEIYTKIDTQIVNLVQATNKKIR